ncbi:MAG: glutaredoxin [Gammaproteobacteria bacterium]|nr:glutaredoxin [Gammaproteobacteria bacterium]
MTRVTIYSTASCPICDKTKTLLKRWGIPYTERKVDNPTDRSALKEMLTITNNARTVPQIVIDGRWIGGFSELTELHMEGAIDALVEKVSPT